MTVYGPYKSSIDGRWRVVIVSDLGVKITKSYPRFIMEKFLDETLLDTEDVHHIDGNIDNNDISNLEIVYKSDHVREHSTKYVSDLETKCCYCDKEITLTPKQQSERTRNANRGKVGPFCSRSCSGKYGVEIQRALK